MARKPTTGHCWIWLIFFLCSCATPAMLEQTGAEFDADSDGYFDAAYKVDVDNLGDGGAVLSANALSLLKAADYATMVTLLGVSDVTLDTNADTILSLSTQEIGLDTQAANTILAGPTSGAAAVPTMRALVDADIPDTITASNYTPKVPSCLTAAPGSPSLGQIECADGDNWQIDASQGTDDWLVRYRVSDTTWVGFYNITDGVQIVSQIDETVPIADGDGTGSLLWAFAFEAQRTITIPGDASASLVVATDTKLNRYHQTAHVDPDNLYDSYAGTIVLDPKTAGAITITDISVYLNEDPTNELTITLYHKAAAIGYTGGTTIDANDTVAGTFVATSSFDDATIPAGSKIWLVIGDNPDATTTGMEVSLTGTYD